MLSFLLLLSCVWWDIFYRWNLYWSKCYINTPSLGSLLVMATESAVALGKYADSSHMVRYIDWRSQTFLIFQQTNTRVVARKKEQSKLLYLSSNTSTRCLKRLKPHLIRFIFVNEGSASPFIGNIFQFCENKFSRCYANANICCEIVYTVTVNVINNQIKIAWIFFFKMSPLKIYRCKQEPTLSVNSPLAKNSLLNYSDTVILKLSMYRPFQLWDNSKIKYFLYYVYF